MNQKECCSNKKKERDEKEYKDLLNRLRRIEGQVRGVEKMVENDAYCVDILTQVSAVTAALNSFNKVLLANHIRTCVTPPEPPPACQSPPPPSRECRTPG